MRRHPNCILDTNQEAELAARYRAGESTLALAAVYGLRSHVSVLRLLAALGIARRTTAQAMLGHQNARKHTVQQGFFTQVETEPQAYYLGLLFADGWVTDSGMVCLGSVDRELVEGFRAVVGSSAPVTIRPPKKDTHQSGYEIRFSCRRMAADLARLGCTPRKSETVGFPTGVPEHLLHHFLRGYWDGDGWVIPNENGVKVGMCGSWPFLEGAARWLHGQGMPLSVVHPHGSIARFEFNGRIVALRFRSILFVEATTSLERKRSVLYAQVPRYLSRVPKDLRPLLEEAMPARRVDPVTVAKALGAEIVSTVSTPQSPVGRMAVQQERFRRMPRRGTPARVLVDVDVADHPGSPVRRLVDR